MSLYLCVFDGDQEMEGVEVGPYSDYNSLRSYVVKNLEGGAAGSVYPTFVLHSDCDGTWSTDECVRLRAELGSIHAGMRELPPASPAGGQPGSHPRCALDSFTDVDGQVLIERLQALVEVAIQRGRPILFQ
jgi:hypothetical protein